MNLLKKNIKVIILAGGLGSRLGEYTKKIPKPMVLINKKPILIRIINIFQKHGFKNFYIAGGYKVQVIKNYFKKLEVNNKQYSHKISKLFCNLKVINTGLKTMTGGRIKKFAKIINKDEIFLFTYGDGIANVNLNKLFKHHLKSKKITTVTAVRPPARFGEIKIRNNLVINFKEKPQVFTGWINGGFFVTNGKIFDFIKNDKTILEKEPLENLCKKKQLNSFRHSGFWKCVDTKRDIDELNKILK